MFKLFVLSSLFLACGEEDVVDAPPANVQSKKNSVGDANVTSVFAREEADGLWTFHVSVEHEDVNWYDFADGWDVVLPDGTSLKSHHYAEFTHKLRHPHVHEQPFTRTQNEIAIPEGTKQVTVRAHDKKDGWGGQEIEVLLNVRFGDKYSVKRAL